MTDFIKIFYIDQDGNKVYFVPDDTHLIFDNQTVFVGIYDMNEPLKDGTFAFRVDAEFDIHYEIIG